MNHNKSPICGKYSKIGATQSFNSATVAIKLQKNESTNGNHYFLTLTGLDQVIKFLRVTIAQGHLGNSYFNHALAYRNDLV